MSKPEDRTVMTTRFSSRSASALASALAISLALASCGQSNSWDTPEVGADATSAESARSPGSAAAATNRDVVEAIERLRVEMTAIRRLLERGTPGGASAADLAPRGASSAPVGEADWADLERAAESRLVIESVSRYRSRLIPDLLTAEAEANAGPRPVEVHSIENGVPVVREETIDAESLTESADFYRRVLAGLGRVRSIEDLARWRNEFEIEPLE
jgi:hypothetical protein